MHIGFYDSCYWRIQHVLSPKLFFLALSDILPDDAVIYLDAKSSRDKSLRFLDKYKAEDSLVEKVASNISSKVSVWTGHFLINKNLKQAFRRHFIKWNFAIADDIVCYRRGELLLWFHDAFSGGDLHISGSYSKNEIAGFCLAMAPVFESVVFKSDSTFKNFE